MNLGEEESRVSSFPQKQGEELGPAGCVPEPGCRVAGHARALSRNRDSLAPFGEGLHCTTDTTLKPTLIAGDVDVSGSRASTFSIFRINFFFQSFAPQGNHTEKFMSLCIVDIG